MTSTTKSGDQNLKKLTVTLREPFCIISLFTLNSSLLRNYVLLITFHVNSSEHSIVSFKVLLSHLSDRSSCRARIIAWRNLFLNAGFHLSVSPHIRILSVSLSTTASHFSWRRRYLILLKHWQHPKEHRKCHNGTLFYWSTLNSPTHMWWGNSDQITTTNNNSSNN